MILFNPNFLLNKVVVSEGVGEAGGCSATPGLQLRQTSPHVYPQALKASAVFKELISASNFILYFFSLILSPSTSPTPTPSLISPTTSTWPRQGLGENPSLSLY